MSAPMDTTTATGRRLRKRAHPCPECGGEVIAAGPAAIFCSRSCKRAHHDRTERRGARLLPYVMAARQTRDGTRGDKETGAHAAHVARTLMERWRDEDAAAGRMSATELTALRIRLGHDWRR